MFPSSAPLVPDDQLDERAFFARDLDEERDLSGQTVKRGPRHGAMRRPSIGTRIPRVIRPSPPARMAPQVPSR